jgi:hypothetical protein
VEGSVCDDEIGWLTAAELAATLVVFVVSRTTNRSALNAPRLTGQVSSGLRIARFSETHWTRVFFCTNPGAKIRALGVQCNSLSGHWRIIMNVVLDRSAEVLVCLLFQVRKNRNFNLEARAILDGLSPKFRDVVRQELLVWATCSTSHVERCFGKLLLNLAE